MNTRTRQNVRGEHCDQEQRNRTNGPPQVAKALFADVMEGSVNRVIDPRNCILLTKVRKPVRSGVKRIKALFRGHNHVGDAMGGSHAQGNQGFREGVVAGSDNPIVIPLTGVYRRYVIDYFKSKGMTEADAREQAGTKSAWYGVVDGMHRLLAIIELIEEEPDIWSGFSWPFIVLKGGHDIQTLKQLTRHQKFKHSASHYIETTLFGTISGLREEADRLRAESADKTPTAMAIAFAFDGNVHKKTSTRKQTATLAVRLAPEVVEVIGEIVNSEHPDLACRSDYATQTIVPRGASREVVMRTMDCRVYRNFINATSLKSATKFLNADGQDAVSCQISTLYRIRDSCRLNRFKPVSHKTVCEQFEKAFSAMREARKFEELLESTTWPVDMQTLQRNLIETTKFDQEVTTNKGNEFVVLPTILDVYRRVCPETAAFKEMKYKASHVTLPEDGKHDQSTTLISDTSPTLAGGDTNVDAVVPPLQKTIQLLQAILVLKMV